MRKASWIGLLLLGAALTADDTKPLAGWTATNAMSEARANSCAVRMPGNRVLVAGGTGKAGDLASVEIYSSDVAFTLGAAMSVPRSHFTCTLLTDGTVLAAGGASDGSAETYDASADTWTPAANAGEARSGQTATLLVDGRVLLAGGSVAGDASSTLEIFDPLTRALTRLDAPLLQARQDHAASLLPDGTVLLIGGRNASGPLDSVEIFDPAAGTVTAGPSLTVARSNHSATPLDDGRILVAGGFDGQNDLDTAEIFDPATGLWSLLNVRLNVARHDHLALLVSGNGGVLLAGGMSTGQATGASELFLPWDGTFAALGSLTKPRTGIAGAAFDGGSILATGGSNANGPQAACGVLFLPALQFSAATTHPTETSQASGTNFPGSTAVSFTLDLQGAIAGSIIASAQSRLITKSLTTAQSGTKIPLVSVPPIPVFAAQLADAGQTFRLTAKSGTTVLASAIVPVKVKVSITPPSSSSSFEGLTATLLVQIVGAGNTGTLTGTLTSNLGGDVRTSAINATGSSAFVSLQKTNLQVGTLAESYTYSGDALHEAASATASFVVVSRILRLAIGFEPLAVPGASAPGFPILPAGQLPGQGNTLIAGIPANLTVTMATPSSIPNAPLPSGSITFSVNGSAIGTAMLAPSSRVPGSVIATFAFTPLTSATLNVSAAYSGDATYHGVTQFSQMPVQKAPATLTMTAAATFTCSSAYTVSATLTYPPAVSPTNQQVFLLTDSGFFNSVSPIATGSLTPGPQPGSATATFSAMLSRDVTSLRLAFQQDPAIGDVSSVPISVHSGPAAVNISPTFVTQGVAGQGGTVKLTATVNPPGVCGRPGPTGVLQLLDGGTLVGQSLLPGKAPKTITDGTSNTISTGSEDQNSVDILVPKTSGRHSYVITYGGDALYLPLTLSPLVFVF